MNKSLFTILLAALALMFNAQQAEAANQNTADNSITFGYCGELYEAIGFGTACTSRAAIEITPEVIAKYQGAQISQVLIGAGSNAGKDAKVLILGSLEDNDTLYSQEIKLTTNRWNEITLDTPYTIGEKSFYVGYEVTTNASTAYPIGVDNEAACPESDWVGMYDEEKGAWAWEHTGASNFGNVCIRLVLTGDKLPQYDFELNSAKIHDYIATGKEFSIEATVKNIGTQDAQSFDVACQIGNAEPVVTTINTAVASNSTVTFTIEGLSAAEEGEQEIKLEVTSIDGNADQYTDNNTYTKVANFLSNLATRKVLIEEFSTTGCVNCPRAHTTMKDITEGRDDIALVVHHAGYGTDNFTIAASRSYLNFYNESSYAPAMMIDRRPLADQGALGYSGAAPGPVFGVTSKEDIMKYINYCFDQPALVSVNVEDSYNEETREFTVRVWGEAAIELPSSTVINVYITESGMIGYQKGGGNDYVHNHAIRANLTTTWGDALTIENGKYDVTYTYEISEKWEPENMSVVAFVSNYDSKDVNNCVVYNTNFKEFAYEAGVNNITRNDLNVWAANGSIYVSGNYEQAEVYATDGRLVKVANGAQSINIEAAGIYIVRIDGTTYKVAIR